MDNFTSEEQGVRGRQVPLGRKWSRIAMSTQTQNKRRVDSPLHPPSSCRPLAQNYFLHSQILSVLGVRVAFLLWSLQYVWLVFLASPGDGVGGGDTR